MAKKAKEPPIVVIFGDEDHQKSTMLDRALNALLPPEIDRTMALSIFDGTQSEEQGGPSFAGVMDDLATLPFLAPRRVVAIRDADSFISSWRERLENYLDHPSPTGTLVLVCRSLPKNTRLYKAAQSAGGELHECKKLSGRGLVEFVEAEAQARGKQMQTAAAGKLCNLIGQDQGLLAGEVEKLALYAGDRKSITSDDVTELVGQTREEKIFAVMDAAAVGELPHALQLWQGVLETDPAAAFRAVGGIAFVLRKWLSAQRMAAEGLPVRTIAPKVMMWGREAELQKLLARLPLPRLERIVADLAELDSQAKSGARTIDRGVEALLAEIATP